MKLKNNEELSNEVRAAIRDEPVLRTAKIEVSTENGVVTLSGTVDNYVLKAEAQDVTKSISGVTSVIDKIAIKSGGFAGREKLVRSNEIINGFAWSWRSAEKQKNINPQS